MTRTVMLASIAPGLFISGAIQAAPLGSPYSATLTVIGGGSPYRFAESGSPPSGLSFTDNGNGTCTFSGTPTVAGNFPITITVTDGQRKTAARNFLLSSVALPLQITGVAPSGTQGTAYSYSYSISGGIAPYNCSVLSGSFPPGLSLSSGGSISGTPTSAGAYSFVVAVTDSAGASATVSQSISIAYSALTLSGSYPSADRGAAYSQNITISGGNGVYTNPRTTSGSVPAGLTLSIVGSALRLSGTPTSSTTPISFTVAVDSGDGQTATSAQSMTINSLSLSGTYSAAVNNTPYQSDLLISHGSGTYSNPRATIGSVPAGLALSIVSVSGSQYLRMSGTPTGSPGTVNFTAAVDSSDGQTATSAQSIAVSGDPNFSSVSALLHFDGTNNSTTFTDVKTNSWLASGGAKISTAVSKFGGASGSFAASASSNIVTLANSKFDFGSGDFTIETWVYPNSLTSTLQTIYTNRNSTSTGGVQLVCSNASTFLICWNSSGTVVAQPVGPAPTISSMNFIQVVRSGSTWTVAVNGTAGTAVTASGTIGSGSDVYVGKDPTSSGPRYLDSYIDDLRVTKGVARSFAVPTNPFPNA